MLSFLQPILSYSQGRGEGTIFSVPPKPLHSHRQASTGRSWKTQGARHHLHLAANATSYVAVGIQASRSPLPPSALPMHRMFPSSSVPGTYLYRGQAHAFLDMFGAVLIPQPMAKPKWAVFQGAEFHHRRQAGGQNKEHTQGAQRAAPVLGIKHQRYTHRWSKT